MLKIENEFACVEFKTHAAEITSFYNKETGLEYMYDGNPKFWTGRNPILFPIVGSTWNKEIIIDGQVYHMGNHGFCRNSDFTVEELSENKLVLSLESSEETLKQYPFEFKLSVQYRLTGRELSIVYFIENRSNKVMPFNFGLHPAFKCPLSEEENFFDYKVEFACPEKLNQFPKGNYTFEGREFNLDYSIFDEIPTYCFENVKSPYVTLTNGKHGVKVMVEGYRWLAFWTKKNAPYLCIEPWHSHGDFNEKTECIEFADREGTLKLEPGRTFVTSYKIEVF